MDMEISQKSNSFVVKKMMLLLNKIINPIIFFRDKLVLDPSGVRNLKQSLKSELNSSLFR